MISFITSLASPLFQKAVKNKFWIYAILIGSAISFSGGFYTGWKTKGAFQDQSNMKVIKDDIKTLEKQNEIDSRSYDVRFRDNVLRAGKL